MKKAVALVYGLLCYLTFIVTFLYAIGFVSDLVVPKTIDSGPRQSLPQALLVDLGLMALFGVQHSLMARAEFKRRWVKVLPKPLERSTYVLLSSLLFGLLFWQWQPMPQTMWEVRSRPGDIVLTGLELLGWSIVLIASFLIDHFELFGLRQVYRYLLRTSVKSQSLRTPLLYKLVRHPMMLGLLIAFWVTPSMTLGRLVFALGMTLYIVTGVHFEECDLVRDFGQDYVDYQRKTSMVLPISPMIAVKRVVFRLSRATNASPTND